VKLAKVLQVVGDPPVTVDECRQHLEAQRYDDTTVDDLDDAMIEGFRDAAIDYCERFTGLSFATKVLELAQDTWPPVGPAGPGIELPQGPVREVLEVRTGADASSSAASSSAGSSSSSSEALSSSSSDAPSPILPPTSYTLDDFRAVAVLLPVSTWPALVASTNIIRIRYLAGFGVDSDGGEALPRGLRAALMLVMCHLYKNREASTDKALAEIPLGVQALLRQHRVRWGFA
jgi:hypothetical protein